MAFETVADLISRGRRIDAKQIVSGKHHSRCAEAALQTMLVPERLLQRVKLAGWRKAFNGGYRSAVGLHRKTGARLHRGTVDQHRARADLTGVAADLRTCEARDLAQKMHQQKSWLDVPVQRTTVDCDCDGE